MSRRSRVHTIGTVLLVAVTAILLTRISVAFDNTAVGRDDGQRFPGFVQPSHDNDDEDSRIRQGFKIAPVPLNLRGKNPALVGLGSYIVNAVADCGGRWCRCSPRTSRRWDYC